MTQGQGLIQLLKMWKCRSRDLQMDGVQVVGTYLNVCQCLCLMLTQRATGISAISFCRFFTKYWWTLRLHAILLVNILDEHVKVPCSTIIQHYLYFERFCVRNWFAKGIDRLSFWIELFGVTQLSCWWCRRQILGQELHLLKKAYGGRSGFSLWYQWFL